MTVMGSFWCSFVSLQLWQKGDSASVQTLFFFHSSFVHLYWMNTPNLCASVYNFVVCFSHFTLAFHDWNNSLTLMIRIQNTNACLCLTQRLTRLQLYFINPERAHERPGDGLCQVCASCCRMVLQDRRHHHRRSCKTDFNKLDRINVYMSIMQSVCVFCILVQLLSPLNRFSLLLFRLIQRHRLCPARRLSGRSETRGSPL